MSDTKQDYTTFSVRESFFAALSYAAAHPVKAGATAAVMMFGLSQWQGVVDNARLNNNLLVNLCARETPRTEVFTGNLHNDYWRACGQRRASLLDNYAQEGGYEKLVAAITEVHFSIHEPLYLRDYADRLVALRK